MKAIIKVSLLVLGLLVAYTSHADSVNVVSTTATGSRSFRLTLEDEATNVNIKLVDQYGAILYNEYVSGPVSYDRIYNVSSLPTGKYQLELEYPNRHQELSVEIKSDQVLLDQSEMVEYFKPMVRQKGDKVSVNLLNTKRGPLRILVYDRETNELLSQQSLKGDLLTGKQFDFSEAGPGAYLISMTCNGRIYSHTVTIDE
jgi:hypothetical protein